MTIRPPHPQNLQTTLPTVRMIVDVSKSVLVLSNQNVIKLLKSKVITINRLYLYFYVALLLISMSPAAFLLLTNYSIYLGGKQCCRHKVMANNIGY